MKMKVKRKQAVMLGLIAVFAVLLAITMLTGKPSADGEYTSTVYATALSLLPPVIAIGLALFTKEVYTSLLAGILAGALLYANLGYLPRGAGRKALHPRPLRRHQCRRLLRPRGIQGHLL